MNSSASHTFIAPPKLVAIPISNLPQPFTKALWISQRNRGGTVPPRPATSICQLRYDRMEQGPTDPHTGHSTFLLSSGGAGGGY